MSQGILFEVGSNGVSISNEFSNQLQSFHMGDYAAGPDKFQSLTSFQTNCNQIISFAIHWSHDNVSISNEFSNQLQYGSADLNEFG